MKKKMITLVLLAMISVTSAFVLAMEAFAQDADEMARKMQDPLGNIKAIMTDNGIELKSGNDDETSYSFQIQPVYAMPFEKFNFISRAVIPILGIAGGGQKPILGPPISESDSLTWGLSDITLQFFFNPHSESAWKWGLGPTFALKTRSKDELAGPGWGAGAVGVLVGNLSENLSLAMIGGQMWGEENNFSTAILQPMLFYNFPSLSGVSRK